MKTAELYDGVVNWIRMWFADKPANAPVVIGISGGKDSTICAALLADALGKERVIGVMMPNGEQKDIADSEQVIRTLGIKGITVNIGQAYDALTLEIVKNDLNGSPNALKDAYETNTPARLRMVTLYGIAAQVGGFVVNTCNLSESVVGWETYGGDGFGDFSPLGKLTVDEVKSLGIYMQLPANLVEKAPSDGMCGATDEDKLGFTYAELDNFIRDNRVNDNIGRILELNRKSHFKHENIHIPTYDPGLPISEKLNW